MAALANSGPSLEVLRPVLAARRSIWRKWSWYENSDILKVLAGPQRFAHSKMERSRIIANHLQQEIPPFLEPALHLPPPPTHPSTPPITHRGTTRSHPRLLTQNLVEHQAFNNKCASRPLAHVDALWAGRGSVPAAAMISGAGAQQAHPPNAHRSGGVHATVFYQATLTMQAVKEATLQRTVESYCM